MKGLESKIDELTNLLRSQREQPRAVVPEDEEVPEILATPEDFEKYLSIRDKRAARERQGYEAGYGAKFLELGKDDPDYDEVEKEMLEKFNIRATGNPAVDAELNYLKAKNSLISKKTAAPAKPKFTGKQEKATGTGTTMTSRNVSSSEKEPELDEYAKEYIKRTGMSSESVAAALARAK